MAWSTLRPDPAPADASTDVTGQAGVGVALATIGWGFTLGTLMILRGKWSRRP